MEYVETSASPEQAAFRVAPGKSFDRQFEEWWEAFERDLPALTPPTPPESGQGDTVTLRAKSRYYKVPVETIRETTLPPAPLPTTPPVDVKLERMRLLDVALRLDQAHQEQESGSALRREQVIRRLMDRLETGAGAPFGNGVTVPSGRLQLFQAPTGSGKSVLAQVAAVAWAEQGVPVVLAVPDIREVQKVTHRLQQDVRMLGLSLCVAPAFSQRNRFKKLVEQLEEPPEYDADGRWTLKTLGYTCRLSTYAEDQDGPPEPGDEPCFWLQQQKGRREKAVACPFAGTCSKQRLFQDAALADILVVNHHALLAGRVRYPFEQERGAGATTVTEIVLRRAGVVLIDEIDAYQKIAIELRAGTLALSSYGSPSPFEKLQQAIRQTGVEGRADASVDQVKRDVLHVVWMGQELANMTNRNEVSWPPSQPVKWTGDDDGWLAKQLYGERTDGPERTRSFFERGGEGTLEAWEEPLREALQPWVERRLDSEESPTELHARLRRSLEGWLWPEERRPLPAVLNRITDVLLLRTVLGELERTLRQLRVRLPELEALGVAQASNVRDALRGYRTTSPSPAGPLGRRVYGFTFKQTGDAPGILKAQALVGDPHGDVERLGDAVALGLAGHQRCVIGLSATARFSGAPMYDVSGDLLLTQPDPETDVSIRSHAVFEPGAGGRKRKVISGISGEDRLRTLRELAAGLVPELRRELERLRSNPETEGRARLLLVTTSYREARAVGEGLLRSGAVRNRAAGEELSFKAVLSDQHDDGALPALRRRHIESFPGTQASVLIAPLSVIARGYNIIQPGDPEGKSALGAIYVLVRPVPPLGEAARLLAHISYGINRSALPSAVGEAIDAERRRAEARRAEYQHGLGPFSRLDPSLRFHVVADVLVDLAQLAGRARRGRTRADFVLVDGAFESDRSSWRDVVVEVFQQWHKAGKLEEMVHLHGSFVRALAAYAHVNLESF